MCWWIVRDIVFSFIGSWDDCFGIGNKVRIYEVYMRGLKKLGDICCLKKVIIYVFDKNDCFVKFVYVFCK